jgi:hypothetical protein
MILSTGAVPPDVVTKLAEIWSVSEAEVVRILQVIASVPYTQYQPTEGITPSGIRWRSTTYHGEDRRR